MKTIKNSVLLPQLKDGTNFTNWKLRIKLLLEGNYTVEIFKDKITNKIKVQDIK